MSKQAKIFLTFVEVTDYTTYPNKTRVEYRVEKVIDSVSYSPGQTITKECVADLCRNGAWTVTISGRK